MDGFGRERDEGQCSLDNVVVMRDGVEEGDFFGIV